MLAAQLNQGPRSGIERPESLKLATAANLEPRALAAGIVARGWPPVRTLMEMH